MNKKISKLGLIFVGLFLILAICFVYEYFQCRGEWLCGLLLAAPAAPWFFMLEDFTRNNHTLAILLLIFSVIINIIIMYFLGFGLSKLFTWGMKKFSKED